MAFRLGRSAGSAAIPSLKRTTTVRGFLSSSAVVNFAGIEPCDQPVSITAPREPPGFGVNVLGNVKRIVAPAGTAYPGTLGSGDLSKTNHASNGLRAASPVLTIG